MINGQILHQSNILQWFSVVSKYLPKNKFQLCVFFDYDYLKRFVWKDDNIFAYKQKIENWAHFLAEKRCVDVQWQKIESVNIYFFRYFLTPNM